MFSRVFPAKRRFILIRFEHVSLHYGNQTILNDLNFEIKEGQFAVLIGPSGCGKTTTLKMINRLIQPDSGHIYLNGEDVAKTDRYQLRRRIGYVIQQVGLFPNMTVAQNICVVPRLLKEDGVFLCSGIIDTRGDEVAAALEAAGLHVIRRREKTGWIALEAKQK